MRQVSQRLPASVPICKPGHRPQLVQTIGAPAGHRIGTASPDQWHVECWGCGIGTVPTDDRAVAILRWRGIPDLFHIPLCRMAHVRTRVAAALARA